MRFSVLGPVGVVVDGRRVWLGRGHERTILAVLLAADGAVVGPDRLIDALWGSKPPASARKSLQSYLSRLRLRLRQLAGDAADLVESGPEGYRIKLADDQVDARQFAALVTRARGASAATEALALLREAEACWAGPAFGDLGSHPAVREAAEQLERQRHTAAVERAEMLLALGRHEDLIAGLPAVIAEDPYHEQAHSLLMRALLASGRRADALTIFAQLRTRLRDDLGVDPAPDLRGLHEQMLHQDAQPPEPDAPLPIRPAAVARRADALLGRDRDLAALGAALPDTSLLTLTGFGGVGKTTLAEHLVEATRGSWRDGVTHCALANVRDPEGVGAALLTASGIQPMAGQSLTHALVSGLGQRHLLLFLDNCEHVLAAVTPLVHAIVSGCPSVTVLATSRERLRIPGEQVWPVYPLDLPPAQASVEGVLGAAAGNLFHLRAKAAEPTFQLTEDNAAVVAELCRRLDGLPLAIELAAARVRALSPQAIVDRLDQRFAVVAGGPLHDGGRHRTLEALVAWSYDLLAPAEAELFNRLAVFAGAVPLPAIEAVCADEHLPADTIAGLLGELVDKSMVVVERVGDVRYRLLETMRDFGAQRLEDSGLADAVRRAHAGYYLEVAEAEGERVRGWGEADAVAAITAAMDDLRAAHVWALSHGDLDVALRLPGALSDEVRFRLRDEVTTWARRALALPEARAHTAYPRALTTSAWGATSRDECERAVREATEAFDVLDSASPVAMTAADAIATAALYQGRLADVLMLADRFHPMAQASGYHLAFLEVYRLLARLYRGDAAAAASGLAQVQAAADRSGSPTMQAFARYCEGEVHLERDPDRAAVALAEAVRLGRSVRNRLVEGVALVCLASSQGQRGTPSEALKAFQDVVLHWREVGNHTHQLTAVRNLVVLLAQMGAAREAAFLYGAVTSADTTPTFGVEEQRLTHAWHQVHRQLDEATADLLASRGRRVDARAVGDEALTVLAALVAQ